MSKLRLFIPITKIDETKRLVYGTLTEEIPDKSGEIADYESTKKAYETWSNEAFERSGGKSKGNLRAMHSNIAAGKFNDISFDDENKKIQGVAKIVDDDEWEKVLEGVYTGFSHGGDYAKRWKDPENPSLTRYTPELAEVSLVDNPCVPTATFEYIKSDGSVELRKFTPSHREDSMDPKLVAAAREALAKGTATDEQKALVAKADAELIKAAQDAGAKGEASDEQKALLAKVAAGAKPELVKDGKPVKPKAAPVQFNKWQAADGSFHDSKRQAEIHNLGLEKAAELAPGLAEMDALLKAAKKPAEDDDEDQEGDDEDTKKAKKERREKKVKAAKEAKEKEEKEAADKARKEKEAADKARKEKEDADKAAADTLNKGKKKEGDYGSKEDAGYADPGYQKDKKPRYPLKEDGEFSEEKIRAAWNYINKKKNAAKYSSDEVDKIKAKIIAAWKEKIDKDGPPSADDKSEKAAKLWKAFQSEQMSKGMHDVGRLACFVDELQWFIQSVEFEEALEGDSTSTTPAEMKAILQQLCACLINRVKEETEELLENHEDDEPLAMAAGLPMRHAAAFAKMVGEMRPFDEKDLVKPEVKKAAERFIALKNALEKAGARHSADDKERLMEIHKSACDHVEMVAKCLKAAGVMEDEPEDDNRGTHKLAKLIGQLEAARDDVAAVTKVAVSANEALMKAIPVMQDLQKSKEELAKRVEHLEGQPMPHKGHARAISKTQDGGGDKGETAAEFEARLAKMNPSEQTRELMKQAMSRPMEVPAL
jgi:hypothetical protein